MRIMITGGAGFIGSNAADHFLGQGHGVTIYDNLSRLTRRLDADDDEVRDEGRVSWIGHLVLVSGRIPRGRGNAPESVQPSRATGREPGLNSSMNSSPPTIGW